MWLLDGYWLSGPGPVGFSVSFHPWIKLMVVAHGSLTVAFLDTPSASFAFMFFIKILAEYLVIQGCAPVGNSSSSDFVTSGLCPASLTHKNHQRCKIIHCMCPVGHKD